MATIREDVGCGRAHHHLSNGPCVRDSTPTSVQSRERASNGMCLHVLDIGPLLPHNTWMSFGIFLASSGFISPPLARLRPGMPKMKQATRNPYKFVVMEDIPRGHCHVYRLTTIDEVSSLLMRNLISLGSRERHGATVPRSIHSTILVDSASGRLFCARRWISPLQISTFSLLSASQFPQSYSNYASRRDSLSLITSHTLDTQPGLGLTSLRSST